MTREQAIEMARAELHEQDVSVGYFDDGAEGAGWYAWITELPEEGSTLLVTSDGDPGERAVGWVASAIAAAEAKGRADGAREMRERVIETMVNLEAAALVRNGTGYGELRAMCIESVRKRIEALPLDGATS